MEPSCLFVVVRPERTCSFYMKFAGERDVAPTTGMHVDDGGAIVIEVDGIQIRVLLTMYFHINKVITFAGNALLILKDAACEIETKSATIRYAVSTTKER